MTDNSEKKSKINRYESMRIYFDGGCRPNPGQMDVCIVLDTIQGKPESMSALRIGHGTNNVAEWSAALWAAKTAREKGVKNFILMGDSNLVVNQLNGVFKVSDKFKPFLQEFKDITEGMTWSAHHVYRDVNLAGIALEDLQ